jgi:pimeloyl-ACP methyl ester carboxylesterase
MEDDSFTLENCVDTLLAVAEYARKQYPEVEDLCIFATGFGAYVTLIALQDLLEMPGKVKLVVQTPSVRMHETLLSMLRMSRETLWAMHKAVIRAPRPFEVTYRFFEELQEHIALTTYPIPMLILHGEDDSYIRMTDVQQFHRINEQSKLVIIPGASHRFLEDGAWDMVLDLTRDWFEFEQVLLSDWS